MSTADVSTTRPLKILLAKVGFDGHDRGVKILASIFRERGHEVVYLGKYLTVETVIAAAIDEDVDVVGLSFLSGSHVGYCQELVKLLAEHGRDDVLLIVGGVIPHQDMDALEAVGVDAVFAANTDTRKILSFLDQWPRVTRKRAGTTQC